MGAESGPGTGGDWIGKASTRTSGAGGKASSTGTGRRPQMVSHTREGGGMADVTEREVPSMRGEDMRAHGNMVLISSLKSFCGVKVCHLCSMVGAGEYCPALADVSFERGQSGACQTCLPSLIVMPP
jgi:hypothetical protein